MHTRATRATTTAKDTAAGTRMFTSKYSGSTSSGDGKEGGISSGKNMEKIKCMIMVQNYRFDTFLVFLQLKTDALKIQYRNFRRKFQDEF